MFSSDADRSDVLDSGYSSLVVSVGTTQVEAKCAASRLSRRQGILLYNDSTATIFYGPSGVTTSGSTKGIQLRRGQWMFISLGDVAIFMIAATDNNNVIVQEMS